MTNEQRFWVILIIAYIIGVMSATKCSGQTTSLVRVQHDSFVSYYDTDKHCPAIMVYMLERAHFAGNERLSGRHFKADTKLPRPRVHDGDYRNSGFVRGHLCAAADRDSKRSWLKETYLTSNLVPMTYTCNSGAWKVIEDSLRVLAIGGHRLKVVKFPVWKGQRVIPTGVGTILVPDYFFCLAECQDCKVKFSLGCENVLGRCRLIADLGEVRPFVETYVQLILHNIIELWSLEESETTTP